MEKVLSTDYPDWLSEWELIAILDDPQVEIHVSKVGGGTKGEAYSGSWNYEVLNHKGRKVAYGSDLYSGMPKTHDQMVRIIVDYWVPEWSQD